MGAVICCNGEGRGGWVVSLGPLVVDDAVVTTQELIVILRFDAQIKARHDARGHGRGVDLDARAFKPAPSKREAGMTCIESIPAEKKSVSSRCCFGCSTGSGINAGWKRFMPSTTAPSISGGFIVARVLDADGIQVLAVGEDDDAVGSAMVDSDHI